MRFRDPALRVFVWSRIAIWAFAALAWFWLRAGSAVSRAPGYAADMWANWDGTWYLRIAQHGYSTDPVAAAFFPLYPGLLAVGGRVLGGRYIYAGILFSLAACAVAFVLLRKLAELELGPRDASRTVLYLAVFPLSLFLQALYTESLYLALAVGAFLAARRGRWPLAALSAAACCLARPSAIAVVAGLLVLAWQSPVRRRAVPLVAASPLAFAVFPLFLWWETGRPGDVFRAERYWHRALSPAGPFAGVGRGATAAWHGLVTHSTVVHAGLDPARTRAAGVEAFLWLIVFVVLAVLVWRWFGAAYGVFAAISLALPLSEPAAGFPLVSLPRYGLVIFPFFFVLARLGRDPRRHTVILCASVLLLALDVARWSLGTWVA
jgi:hypothetical protein